MLSNFSFQAVHNRQVIKINKNDFHLPTVNSRHTLGIYLHIIAETSYNDHFSGVASHVNYGTEIHIWSSPCDHSHNTSSSFNHFNFNDFLGWVVAHESFVQALPGNWGGPMSPVWILKRLVSVFINACRLFSALPSLSHFGRERLSLVAISFYALSLLFGPCRLSEFTLAGPLFR